MRMRSKRGSSCRSGRCKHSVVKSRGFEGLGEGGELLSAEGRVRMLAISGAVSPSSAKVNKDVLRAMALATRRRLRKSVRGMRLKRQPVLGANERRICGEGNNNNVRQGQSRRVTRDHRWHQRPVSIRHSATPRLF
jgi:hypothetical protein